MHAEVVLAPLHLYGELGEGCRSIECNGDGMCRPHQFNGLAYTANRPRDHSLRILPTQLDLLLLGELSGVDLSLSVCIATSASVLAETSVPSPQKINIFFII